jgi:hypothetical protein
VKTVGYSRGISSRVIKLPKPTSREIGIITAPNIPGTCGLSMSGQLSTSHRRNGVSHPRIQQATSHPHTTAFGLHMD